MGPISCGRGTGFARKNSRSIAFRLWPIGSDESVMWQVRPFLCSPAHVYLLGRKEASSRSLLYVSGLTHVLIFHGSKGLSLAATLNIPKNVPVLCWTGSHGSCGVRGISTLVSLGAFCPESISGDAGTTPGVSYFIPPLLP